MKGRIWLENPAFLLVKAVEALKDTKVSFPRALCEIGTVPLLPKYS